MASEGLTLPTNEDLEIQDINISTPLFKVLAPQVGMACDEICKEYMLCKAEERDPRKCLKEGRDVTNCGLEFLQRVKKTCRDEAEAFARCTEWNDWDLWYESCRREQRVYDTCMEKRMGLPKPPFGYFSQVRVHDSKRPKPVPFVPEFPDKTPGLPSDYEGLKERPRHGTRFFFYP